MKKIIITFICFAGILLSAFSQNSPVRDKKVKEEEKNIRKRQREERCALLKQDNQNLKELRLMKTQNKYEGDKDAYRNEKNTMKELKKKHRKDRRK